MPSQSTSEPMLRIRVNAWVHDGFSGPGEAIITLDAEEVARARQLHQAVLDLDVQAIEVDLGWITDQFEEDPVRVDFWRAVIDRDSLYWRGSEHHMGHVVDTSEIPIKVLGGDLDGRVQDHRASREDGGTKPDPRSKRAQCASA